MTNFLQTNPYADEDCLFENSGLPGLSSHMKSGRSLPRNFMKNLQNQKVLANSNVPIIPLSIKKLINKETTISKPSGNSKIYRKLLDQKKDFTDISKKSSIIIGSSRQNLYSRISELCMKNNNSHSNSNSNNVSMINKNKPFISDEFNDFALKSPSKMDLNLVVTNKSQNKSSFKNNETPRIHDKTISNPIVYLKKTIRSHSNIKNYNLFYISKLGKKDSKCKNKEKNQANFPLPLPLKSPLRSPLRSQSRQNGNYQK